LGLLQLDLREYAPYIGEFYATTTTTLFPVSVYPLMKMRSLDVAARFVVRLGDDGLENWGFRPGDYLIFRHQGWPTGHMQLCFIQFGDDAILRIIPDMWSADIELITANDKYEPIRTHRNQFIVTGVCYGILRYDEDIEMIEPDF
jgi:SOS-response transcriptional repressor LexA